ncbi:MAG: hybrid sensor histidine kinase/response regulator [Elusimicrobia bacterium]|nr:hybrid sensor histidine kinase/response regulator [Elusimicrobiota bacterium]
MAVRILVVDDDANLRESVRDNLELEGYEVVEAGTGAEAMKAVVTGFFDVILMDFNLPDSTGIEVIRDIRKVNTESEILMLTAHASLDTALKAIRESVYDFLVKPVDFDVLKRAIGKAVEKLRLTQDNRRLIEDLRKANEQLLYLSNMKSKFLSMASHDLSNSLMTLQVSFEMLMGSLNPSEDQKKRMQYISNGISQLSRLIEDLVDWASIESGKFRLEKEAQDPGKVIEDCVGGHQVRAQQRGIQLKVDVSKGLPKVLADKRRLTQVLGNLLENALRHTAKGGAITIAVEKDDSGVRICVRDTGEGIEPGEIQKIFESFYQPTSSHAARGRLGLGLSISKEIVHSHGGRIWVESKGKGQGASFLFTVPAEKAGAKK